tara:strand:+ start:70 stop:843 length:774 start_codon:yes stop_codon:yes gene_type:complete
MTKYYSIWGKALMSKSQCETFFKDLKSKWPLNYELNEQERSKLINMMTRFYVSPFYPPLNEKFLKIKDKIIRIVYGEGLYREPTFFFYEEGNKVPHNFSVERLLCFGSGKKHESCTRRAALLEAFEKAIFSDKVEWKKEQGYVPGFSPMMHAHHVEGKEFKKIFVNFLAETKYNEEDLINKIYPEHMNFETCHMTYYDGTGWRFSTELGLGVEKQWVKFHRKNAEYEKIEPTKHRKKTTEEIKFNTSIKHKVWDILK